MPQGDVDPIAEAKENREPAQAPLRLMTQFLKAVSESRMEDALSLAQTILTFEPGNVIILDYQATLAQYVNNERELAEAGEGGADENEDEDGEGDTDSGTGSGSLSSTTASVDASTEEASGEDTPEGDEKTAGGAPCEGNTSDEAEKEFQRLGAALRDLRQTRAAANREVASRWDDEKFSAARREVEEVLRRFLPEEAEQAAEKLAKDGGPEKSDSCSHK